MVLFISQTFPIDFSYSCRSSKEEQLLNNMQSYTNFNENVEN